MEKEELYNELIGILNYYTILIDHNQIIYGIGDKYLREFPKNLPKDIYQNIEKKRSIIEKEINDIGSLYRDSSTLEEAYNRIPEKARTISNNEVSSLTFSIVNLMNRSEDSQRQYEKNIEGYYDFEFTLNAQAIVMLNSILEGFLHQIFDLLKKLQPNIRLSGIKKNHNWRIKKLKNVYELQLESNQTFIDIITNMEQIRHIIVHKNGLADKLFIEKTNFENINIGEKVIVKEQFIAIAGLAVSWIAAVIYKAILEKYFSDYIKKTVTIDLYPDGVQIFKEETKKE